MGSAKKTQTITASDVTATFGDTGKKIEAGTTGDGALSYYVSGNHEAIVSDELWQAVQDKIKDAHDFNPAAGRIIKPYEFTKKITCCQCGNHYTRNVSRISKTERIEIWYCYGKIKHGKDFGPSPGLREDRLKEAARQVLGLEEFDSKVFTEQIEQIFTTETGELEFRFYDGTVKRAPIKVFEKKKAPV